MLDYICKLFNEAFRHENIGMMITSGLAGEQST